jgi:hypothetical protein
MLLMSGSWSLRTPRNVEMLTAAESLQRLIADCTCNFHGHDNKAEFDGS